MDIDDIHQEDRTSEAIKRTKESIKYLENIVSKVRRQLNKSGDVKSFDAMITIDETLNDLSDKSSRLAVALKRNTEFKKIYITGDPLRLSQVITILVNNSIDASQNSSLKEVRVNTRIVGKNVEISVRDYGTGIPESVRSNLFEPLHSTKDKGLGIGLFIAKQIVETHFKGSLTLMPTNKYTEFLIKFPKK